jgi:hypothetical protein
MLKVFSFGRWNGEAHDHIAVAGKLATADWIERSLFEKMPHSRPVEVDASLVLTARSAIANASSRSSGGFSAICRATR